MMRRIKLFLAAALIAIQMAVPVFAVEYGSILVETSGGTVALYRVGEINGQGFLLNEEYGGDSLCYDDLLSENMAAWLDGQSKSGQIKAADISGNVLFPDLESGLYLLAQRSAPSGSDIFTPVLVPIPWDGTQWDIHLDMEADQMQPQTEDRGSPGLWIMGMISSALALVVCIQRGRDIVV